MANISDAYGTLTLQGEWTEEHIIALLCILKTQENGVNYSTVIGNFKEALADLKEEGSLNIVGSGRWAYVCNLERLHDWSLVDVNFWDTYVCAQLPAEYKIVYEDYLAIRLWLLKEMHLHGLKIEWEFMDLETGCDFLTRNTGYHSSWFEEPERVYKFVYTETEVENYDCNLKNQVELYDEGGLNRLGEIILELIDMYQLPKDEVTQNTIEQFIMSDPNWFDIPAYPYFGEEEDIPEPLRNKLAELRQGVPHDDRAVV